MGQQIGSANTNAFRLFRQWHLAQNRLDVAALIHDPQADGGTVEVFRCLLGTLDTMWTLACPLACTLSTWFCHRVALSLGKAFSAWARRRYRCEGLSQS